MEANTQTFAPGPPVTDGAALLKASVAPLSTNPIHQSATMQPVHTCSLC